MAPVNNVRGTPSLMTVHLCASPRSRSFSRVFATAAATSAIHPLAARAGRSFTPFICAFFRVYIYTHIYSANGYIQLEYLTHTHRGKRSDHTSTAPLRPATVHIGFK